MTLPVIAIVGPSDSGKTRVATALIQILSGQGYRIAAVKHSPHGHQMDRPGTDSAKLFESGANRTVVSSPGQMTTIERTRDDTSLEEIVASLGPGYDLVVAEGFKASTVPKVLVLGAEELSPPPQRVLAVVSDDKRAGDVPCYGFQELDGLAKQIQDQMLDGAGNPSPISLLVDGAPVSLAPFPARLLARTVYGFLAEFKNLPSDPKRVQLVLETPATPDTR
ncbi:MAG: molybdopterin-guanine dinucleotide biosynthesis protein B [Dehalococcoidia bacterium]